MTLDRKQKILLTLLIIALAFLIWQVYDIFFASNNVPAATKPATTLQPLQTPSSTVPSLTPTTATTVPSVTNAPIAQPAKPPVAIQPITNNATTTLPNVTAPTTVPVVAQPTTATTTPATIQPMRTMNIEAPMTQNQIEYLRLVNRYQIIRMKRMLMDEEVAIVSSKAKIAELNQEIAKTSGTQSSMSNLIGQAAPSSPTGYQLLYVDYQQGQWSATLNKNGQFIEVTTGMRLNDGTQILKINQSGVIIQQNGVAYLLNFYGSTRINYTPSSQYKNFNSASTTNNVSNNPNVSVRTDKPINKVTTTLTAQSTLRNSIDTRMQAASAQTRPSSLMPNPVANQVSPNKPNLALTSQQKNTVSQLETNFTNPTRNYSDAEKQLLNLPPKSYTLQLVSSYRLNDLTDLVKQQGLDNHTHIFQTYYLGRKLYVLVYGNYATERQALQAIQSLPVSLRQLKPWVRTLASVQAAIKLLPKQD